MKLRDIQYFVASAKTRNLTWAAKQYGVAQSTMTRSIQKLETAFGHQLFVRSKNHLLDLTPFAEILLPDMEKLCSTFDSIRHLAQTFESRHSSTSMSKSSSSSRS